MLSGSSLLSFNTCALPSPVVKYSVENGLNSIFFASPSKKEKGDGSVFINASS
jgi:hypothetical protein